MSIVKNILFLKKKTFFFILISFLLTGSCFAAYPGYWGVRSWGVCSATGSQTRNVFCSSNWINSVSGVDDYDQRYCNPASKPVTSRSCTPPKPQSYWSVGSWSACKVGNNMTRSVVCKDSGGWTRADAWCTTPKPATWQSCTFETPKPAVTYSWVVSSWSKCYAHVQARSIKCRNNNTGSYENVLNEYKCTKTRPSTTQYCN